MPAGYLNTSVAHEWGLPVGLRPGLRRLLPTVVKKRVWLVTERLAL
jgi:hypothetical protein